MYQFVKFSRSIDVINFSFVVLDLMRLLLAHPDGSRKLCNRSPFAKQTNVFVYILQFRTGLSANQMLMFRSAQDNHFFDLVHYVFCEY
jgi:hypothetical protein